MSNERPVAPGFESVDAMLHGFDQDRQKEQGEGTYARKGYENLRAREQELAQMLDVPDTAIFNAGMAAICTVFESEELRPGDVIVCGEEAYARTKDVFTVLEKRGIRVERVDSGNFEELEKAVREKNPKLLFVEGVANAPGLPVFDVAKAVQLMEQTNERYGRERTADALLKKFLTAREMDAVSPELRSIILASLDEFSVGNNPFVLRPVVRGLEGECGLEREDALRTTDRLAKFVLGRRRDKITLMVDNTLSSPVLRNPLKEAGETTARIVVVESGTKHYQGGADAVTMGVMYSNDTKAIADAKQVRTRLGTYLQAADEAMLPEHIAEVMHRTVEQQAKNALRLAQFLQVESGITEVMHPNLESHPDHDLAEAINPSGLVTLFYIRLAEDGGMDADDFADRVKEEAGDAVEIGTSFGKERTRLLSGKGNVIRIAAGCEDDAAYDTVETAFRKVLEKNH